MRKSKIEKFSICVLWVLSLMVFEYCTGFIRGIGYAKEDNVVMYVKCFFLTLIVGRCWTGEFTLFLTAFFIFYCSFLILFLYGHINGDFTIISWTNNIMALLGGLSGWLFTKYRQGSIRVSIVLLGSVMILVLFRNYKHVNYFNNFGTFTKSRNIYLSPNGYTLTDSLSDTFHFQKNALYILDFWYTGCASCYRDFPKYAQIAKQYKTPNIYFLSVNWPIPSDTANQSFEAAKKYGNSFERLQGSPNVDVAFGIKAYPTILAMRNDTILFVGNVDVLEDFILKQ